MKNICLATKSHGRDFMEMEINIISKQSNGKCGNCNLTDNNFNFKFNLNIC